MGISTTRRGDADLVERYINTAYDNVKTVADSIEDVNTIVDNLSNVTTTATNIANVNTVGLNITDVNYLADNFAELQSIADDFQEFKGMYYGPSATAPVTRPNGDPIQEGDMYLDTVSKVLFIRVDTYWNSITANLTFNESTVVTSLNRVGTDTVIQTTVPYSVGRNALIVFINNIYQANASKSVNGTYVETNSNIITFPNLLLNDGDEVSVIIGSVVDTINPIVRVTKKRYVTTETNEQSIVLPDSEQYVVGNNSMEVYLNGVLMYAGIDYFETNSTTVTFATPLPYVGTEVVFKKGNIIASAGDISITQQGDVVTLNLTAEFFSTRLTLDRSKVVFLKSYTTANDGRSGSYVYNALGLKSTADGVFIVDPDTLLANQGTGLGQGVWVLQMGLVAERIDAYLGAIYEGL